MDWKFLFFSADGRISRQTFWIGALILLGIGVVLGWIPILGWLISLALIYCWVCLYSKRLHDFGKSGWLQLAPLAITIVLFGIGMAGMGGAAAMGAFSGHDETAQAAMMGGAGLAALCMGLAFLIGIGFLLWVGLTPGEAGANKYGEPPATTPLPAAPGA